MNGMTCVLCKNNSEKKITCLEEKAKFVTICISVCYESVKITGRECPVFDERIAYS